MHVLHTIHYNKNKKKILSKDTIYTKLALMPWTDDNLGPNLSGPTKIGNLIVKISLKFTIFLVFPYSSVALDLQTRGCRFKPPLKAELFFVFLS